MFEACSCAQVDAEASQTPKEALKQHVCNEEFPRAVLNGVDSYSCQISNVEWLEGESVLVLDFDVRGDGKRGSLPKPTESRLLTPFRECIPLFFSQRKWFKERIDDGPRPVFREVFQGSITFPFTSDMVRQGFWAENRTDQVDQPQFLFEYAPGWTLLSLDHRLRDLHIGEHGPGISDAVSGEWRPPSRRHKVMQRGLQLRKSIQKSRAESNAGSFAKSGAGKPMTSSVVRSPSRIGEPSTRKHDPHRSASGLTGGEHADVMKSSYIPTSDLVSADVLSGNPAAILECLASAKQCCAEQAIALRRDSRSPLKNIRSSLKTIQSPLKTMRKLFQRDTRPKDPRGAVRDVDKNTDLYPPSARQQSADSQSLVESTAEKEYNSDEDASGADSDSEHVDFDGTTDELITVEKTVNPNMQKEKFKRNGQAVVFHPLSSRNRAEYQHDERRVYDSRACNKHVYDSRAYHEEISHGATRNSIANGTGMEKGNWKEDLSKCIGSKYTDNDEFLIGGDTVLRLLEVTRYGRDIRVTCSAHGGSMDAQTLCLCCFLCIRKDNGDGKSSENSDDDASHSDFLLERHGDARRMSLHQIRQHSIIDDVRIFHLIWRHDSLPGHCASNLSLCLEGTRINKTGPAIKIPLEDRIVDHLPGKFMHNVSLTKANPTKDDLLNRDQKTDEPQSRDCMICMEAPADATFIHGNTGHNVCCYKCACRLHKSNPRCPICRQRVAQVIQVYKQ